MVTHRLGLGLFTAALGTTLLACGAEGLGEEDAGGLAAPLEIRATGGSGGSSADSDAIIAVDSEGQMFGAGFPWLPLEPRAVPFGATARAAHGDGYGDFGARKWERYIDGAGNVYERKDSTGPEAEWHAVPSDGGGAIKFVDITSRQGGESLAVSEAGKIMVRSQSATGPVFVDNAKFKVLIGATEYMVGSLDECSNGDVLAVSKDLRRLFKFTRSSGVWQNLSLAKFPGDTAKKPRVLDVGCGNVDDGSNASLVVVVGYREGEAPSAYHMKVGVNAALSWSPVYVGTPFGFVTRVDVDGRGSVFYVASDWFNGTKLWRRLHLSSDAEILPMAGTAVDVGI